jgi:hypothetical protein
MIGKELFFISISSYYNAFIVIWLCNCYHVGFWQKIGIKAVRNNLVILDDWGITWWVISTVEMLYKWIKIWYIRIYLYKKDSKRIKEIYKISN